VPIPDRNDVERFCELDGWEETQAESPDHHRYRKRLDDGTVLRTRVSFGRGPICRVPALWAKVWRHQLKLESEDEFWKVLKTRKPAPRGAPAELPPELQMPAWLFEALLYTFGLDESKVRSLSEGEALARYLALCEGGETPA
jgi:hypothetical protein